MFVQEVFQPAKGNSLLKLLSPYPGLHHPIQTVFTQPLQPLTGWSSIIPPYGVHIDRNAVELKYKEAISALSERLGTDKWLLGSTYVSPLTKRSMNNRVLIIL